ncbi:MAG TPA: class I SAM-dependent methyltransferase [Polyangiaceae bacterium]|nr:class I SAM-dependent methyltransferase [Polyangiaceae bacterium]
MNPSQPEISLSDFQRYFPYTPAALCVKECARLGALRRHACPSPILDVGCGDGLFASVAFSDAEVWGIDIDAREGRWAVASRAYSQVLLADVTHAKLPETFFETCIANCSLEHVLRLDLALHNILGCLKPGGRVLMFVPNKRWAEQLLSFRFLAAIGATGLAAALRDGIDNFFRHEHLYDEAGWRKVVVDAGFEVETVEPVLSSATTVAFEALLLPSLAGKLNKTLTTRWTNFPGARRALALPVYAFAKSLIERNDPTPTAEFLVIGRRPES